MSGVGLEILGFLAWFFALGRVQEVKGIGGSIRELESQLPSLY